MGYSIDPDAQEISRSVLDAMPHQAESFILGEAQVLHVSAAGQDVTWVVQRLHSQPREMQPAHIILDTQIVHEWLECAQSCDMVVSNKQIGNLYYDVAFYFRSCRADNVLDCYGTSTALSCCQVLVRNREVHAILFANPVLSSVMAQWKGQDISKPFVDFLESQGLHSSVKLDHKVLDGMVTMISGFSGTPIASKSAPVLSFAYFSLHGGRVDIELKAKQSAMLHFPCRTNQLIGASSPEAQAPIVGTSPTSGSGQLPFTNPALLLGCLRDSQRAGVCGTSDSNVSDDSPTSTALGLPGRARTELPASPFRAAKVRPRSAGTQRHTSPRAVAQAYKGDVALSTVGHTIRGHMYSPGTGTTRWLQPVNGPQGRVLCQRLPGSRS